jgi:hypothetical protein
MEIPKRKPPEKTTSLPSVPKRTISSTQIAKPAASATPKKTFSVASIRPEFAGEKVLLYADTGMGKSTLSALSPKSVFLDLDNGCTKLRHPVTGEPLKIIPGVESFADVRAVLQQPDIFKDFDTVVIDNVTVLQDMAEQQVCKSIPMKGGQYASNIEGYGYKEGYKHLYDIMRFILQDCDALARQGKNVVLIAQANPNKIANPGGEDFLCQGPRLYAGKPSIESLFCEWSDHILYINYQDVTVSKQKKATGGSVRAIYTQPEVYFRAKTRQLKSGNFLPPMISFADMRDDSLWKFMFAEGK